jgi:hypothetical protein
VNHKFEILLRALFPIYQTTVNIYITKMATLPAFNQPQSGPRPVLLQIEDQINKRIDDDVAKLVDCFTDIVKVGEVKII